MFNGGQSSGLLTLLDLDNSSKYRGSIAKRRVILMAATGLATQQSFVLLNRDLLLYAIFIFLFGSGIFSVGADATPEQTLQNSAGNFISQMFWPLVFANSVLLAALCKANLRGLLLALAWLLPLMIWIMASVYWSAFPDLTIRRAGREVIQLVGIVLLISTYSRQTEILRIIFLAFLTILFADLASIPFPSFSYSEIGFKGIHGHKNGLGGLCLFALPLFGLAIFDRRIARWPLTAALASICAVVYCFFHIQRPLLDFPGWLLFYLFAWLGTPLDGPVQGCVHHNLFPHCRCCDYRRARDRPGGNRSLFDRRSDPDWKNGPLAVCIIPMGRKPVFGSRLWRVVASRA